MDDFWGDIMSNFMPIKIQQLRHKWTNSLKETNYQTHSKKEYSESFYIYKGN